MQELFEFSEIARSKNEEETAPLANRVRPRSLGEIVGQGHLLGKESPLKRQIETDRLPSLILWGPPGSGKTTLARVIASHTKSNFHAISAVLSGTKELRDIIEIAKRHQRQGGTRTILFIDEIHRWNKAQQDALLPHIEEGTVTLIGATTENPSFEVIGPLLSRAKVYVLSPLSLDELKKVVRHALEDKERGLGKLGLELDEEALDYICETSDGDARRALNTLEIAASLVVVSEERSGASSRSPASSQPSKDKRGESAGSGLAASEQGQLPVATRPDEGITIRLATTEQALQKKSLLYDKAGEEHYNLISAFIKSMRGSDPDAAVYYLARMLEAGEEPLFLARRMVIFASEDVGNADPQAIQVAIAAQQAFDFVGMPEGWIPLAQSATYLASAPKSNASYMAYKKAKEDVEKEGALPTPKNIRNAPTKLMKGLGYGKDYKYPHSFEGNYVKEEYLPEKLRGKKYYEPTENGYEREIKQQLEKLKK
ncbi:MAG: replication-associated recombination protein A [Deltaproteobacteria bacterium]|nr:replication-associated recombination protein A [Deltaproteobacteria bacterium]